MPGPPPIKRRCIPWSGGEHPGGGDRKSPPADTGPPSSSMASGVAMETVSDMSDTDITHRRRVNNPCGSVSTSDSESPQVYLSALWQSGKLGLAYYDLDTTQIYMMPDTMETDEFTILKRVVEQIQPSVVVVSTKSDERFVQFLRRLGGREDGDREGPSPAVGDGQPGPNDPVNMLPSIDFSLDLCKRRILSMSLPGIPDHFTESERSLFLSSLVPFDSLNMVRALGGLLKLLEKRRVGVELEDADVRVPILSLHLFSLKDMIFIDEDTYCSLQIFAGELHPSGYKAGSSNSFKEGLSLFGILSRCKTLMGNKLLRQWFLRPSRDLQLLKERQDAVAFFMNPRNSEITVSIADCLKNIKNIARGLVRMRTSEAPLSDWQALYKTTYNCIYIGDICRAQQQKFGIIQKISNSFTDDLHRVANIINKIVDFDESSVQNRFVVKTGVDPELDQKKRTYNGLPDFMTKVAREELNSLDENIKECNVIYLPQLGYLLAIPLCDTIMEENNYELPNLDFVFLSNNTAHYRSDSTRELDVLLGDTQCEITDHETSIMHRLQNLILEHSQVLLDVLQVCAELDSLLALATCAREGNYTRPVMTNENTIQIKAGRHPLQELCCTPFVPNDTHSGGDHAKMKLLTGPNASGKSVYLKQVGLIVFMAHIGSFVPADSAEIGLVDGIYTRIQTLESVSIGLSTFMIDLNQVSKALRCATGHSLVLIDEFGKGTQTSDGAALLWASLQYWLDKSHDCPHSLISTHFHSLTSEKLLPQSRQLQYQTMDFLRDGDELVFLYQLVEGVTNSSYACYIASQAELPADIVTRGKEVSDLIRRHQTVNRKNDTNREKQLKKCEDIVTRFIKLDFETADLQKFLTNLVTEEEVSLIH